MPRYASAAATLATLAALTLTGCTPSVDRLPAPSPGAQLAAPTIVDINTVEEIIVPLPNTLGVNAPVLADSVSDITDWTATFAPDGIAAFLPGRTEGSATFNAGLTGLTEGTTTMTLTNTRTGVVRTILVTVTSPAWATAQPVSDLERAAQETRAIADTLVGLTTDDAITAITAAGKTHRIASEDGVANILTMDYRTDRINLTIVNGKVTGTDVG